jgi:hypothetical protein
MAERPKVESRQADPCVLNPPCREDISTEELTSVVFLTSVGPIFNSISRVLTGHNIKTVGLLPRKVPTSFLQPITDDLGLKTAGIYSNPCKCGSLHWSNQVFH